MIIRRALLLFSTILLAALASAPAAAAGPLDAFAAAWAKVNSYTEVMSMYETLGTQSQTRTYTYAYKKPSYARIEITAGPGQGNIAEWDGGNTVSGSKAGMFAGFKKSFSLTDPTVTTLRGDTIPQASFGSILQHFQSTPGDMIAAPGPAINGATTTQVSLKVANPATDGGITYEVLFLSNATNLPVRVWRYVDERPVKQITFTNVQITS